MANLRGIFNDGFPLVDGDRFCSWLPYYHDMGLVGIVLGCVATQRSVDFLPTRDFAMRPRLWLKLISRNRGDHLVQPAVRLHAVRAPPARRRHRGARPVVVARRRRRRRDDPSRVAAASSPTSSRSAGFDARAFLPCYGMAECSLAVSFAPLGRRRHAATCRHRPAVARRRGACRRRRRRAAKAKTLHQLRPAAARLRGRDPRRPRHGAAPSAAAAASTCAAPA